MNIGEKTKSDKLEERPINKFLNSKFDDDQKISDIINSLPPNKALIAEDDEIQELGCEKATNKEIRINFQTWFADRGQHCRVESLGKNKIRIRNITHKPNVPKVNLSSLIKNGFLCEGQVLTFCNRDPRKSYPTERVIVEGDFLRYQDGNPYLPAPLATILRKKYHLVKSTTVNPQSQGPIFFRTENGVLLSDLMDKFRRLL